MGVQEKKVRLYVRSLGCKVNTADAAAVIGALDPDRVALVDDPAMADLALLNSCTVTHKADRDVRKILGGLARTNPDLRVVVSGCATVTCGEALAGFGNVCAQVPPGVPLAVIEALGLASAARARGRSADGFRLLHRQRAFAKVQDGCDARCAYCVIPQVRGEPKSMTVDEAADLVTAYLDQGHLEVVLCGIHLGRFGRERGESDALPRLIRRLAGPFAARPMARLRLSSIEPLEWTPDLIEAIDGSPFVCRHFHVPMQSGDDHTLRAMGRPYSAARYAECIQMLRARFPNAALGTDVLVGFPGEGEAEAGRTVELVSALPINHLHVFTYSRRPGTRAAAMPGQVAPEEIKARAAALRQVADEAWCSFMAEGLGRRHRVLLERVDAGEATGRSEHYRPLRVAGGDFRAGQMIRVRARDLIDGHLVGDEAGGSGGSVFVGGEKCRPT